MEFLDKIINFIVNLFIKKLEANDTTANNIIPEIVESTPKSITTTEVIEETTQIKLNEIASKYAEMYNKLSFNSTQLSTIAWYVNKCNQGKTRYEFVANQLKIPWYVVACVHAREAGFNWACNLHNGEPWDKVTTLVPKGKGPFSFWETAAIDALAAFKSVDYWHIGNALDILEKHNGLGYRKRGVPSPYLWSFSQFYAMGKYVADNKYSETAIDKQIGVATLIKALENKKLIEVIA